jgi:hypothetical protein
MMIDVLRMGFTKGHLLKMTQAERGAFLLFGYTSNQANVLWKVIIASLNREPPDPVDARVSAAQTQVLVRLMIGVLWEAWRAVETYFLKSPLGREYRPLLDAHAAEALDGLQKYFGKQNEIAILRNSFAFHHPKPSEIEAGFQNAANSTEVTDDEWAIYFTHGLLNCCFFMSDMAIAHGMAEALNEKDVLKAHKRLLPKLGPIANQLSEFTFGFAAAVFKKHVGQEISAAVVAKFENPPNMDDVRLPFFLDLKPKPGGLLHPHLPAEEKPKSS